MLMGQVFHNFADAEECGRDALDREGLTSLFDRFDWFARTLSECPPQGAPLIARATNDGVDSWLFLAQDKRGRAAALSSWYTLAFRPIFKGNPDEATRTQLLTKIARQVRLHSAKITLSPMHKDDCDLTAKAFRQAGWIAQSAHTDCNWRLDVAGRSYAEYLASRPGPLRKTIKSKGTRAQMTVTIFDRFDADAWAEYCGVYQDSWKPEEGSEAFLREMAITEGAARTLRLGIGRIGGKAVAAQLWTCENGTAIAHKVAHRQSAAAFSPGTLLSAAMFQHVIDVDQVHCIDFGTGDNAYKSTWMDECAPLFTLTLYNPRKLSGLAGLGKAALKSVTT